MSNNSKNSQLKKAGSGLGQYGIMIMLVVVYILFAFITNGKNLTPMNVNNLIMQNGYVVILAVGMLLCVLTGNVDLGVGSVVASAGAYALGRKTDELIVNAMNTATENVGDYTSGLTKDLILSAVEVLNTNDVPDDGRRFAVVGVHQWNELLSMDEFVSADYVGASSPLVNGFEARKWLGITWVLYNGLPVDGTNRDCFIYHASSIGHACGQEVKTDISWHGERAAHFISNSMSQGAVLIDANGIVRVKCSDTQSA
jgi:hypothetical protein